MDIEEMFRDSDKSIRKGYQFNSFCESFTYNDSDISREDSNQELKKNFSNLQLTYSKLLKENEINKIIISDLKSKLNIISNNNLKLTKKLELNSDLISVKVLKIYLTSTFFLALSVGSLSTFVLLKGL